MDDLLSEFLTETSESIAQVDVELVKLEQNPNDPVLLGSIFRLVHTVKGTCGFLGLPRLEHVAHASENVLGKFRDGELLVTPHAISLILRSIDAIKSILGVLEKTQAEPPGDDNELIAALNDMAEGKEPSGDSHADAPAQEPVEPEVKQEVHVAAPVPSAPAIVHPAANIAEVANAPEDTGNKELAVANQTIRVNVDLLENLMTTVSELVLARNQLLQILRSEKDSLFAAPLQRLNLVTSELQEGVMKARMQPIGNAWSKLPRIVRDLSVELGKKIDLQMRGAETELDRQVLELIKDPLTHMVRNSADHGIEMPADRSAAGKSETGTIVLSAYHEGGHIVIKITDDGKGLALSRIRAKVLENGLASEAELATMPDQQLMQFIFKAGFSTAAKVTSVSGRGVGMDVVRTNIEKIGGTIDLQSKEGKGSQFLIKIPLTLAIVSALIVECGGERLAIPQISVVELVQVSPQSEYRIEYISDAPVLRLRNRLLPLVLLRKTLKLTGEEMKPDDIAFIVVVQAGTSTFGIIVDRVFDTEEIVVKPLSSMFRALSAFSGNTILGDGSVVMILDPNGIAIQSGEMHDNAGVGQAVESQVLRDTTKQSLLLFYAGDRTPKVIPLSLIARLEEIDVATVEYSNGKPVVQYRGTLMPLIPISSDYVLPAKGKKPILVFSDQNHHMGLLADEIVDIVEDDLRIDLSVKRAGFLGSVIVAGKATDVIDTSYYLSQAFEDWFGAKTETAFGEQKAQRVLLVDDSAFFRNLIAPLLTTSGYSVTAVESPIKALALQESGEDFDLIISDIEMPDMNGFEFASTVRHEGRWSKLPILAMSSHATPRDVERGHQAGFTQYVSKFNHEALLAALDQTLNVSEAPL